MAAPSWTLLADTLLHRAVSRRAGRDDASDERYEPIVAEARAAFAEALAAPTAFAQLVRRARLGMDEAEVFAALCAVELEPARQALVTALGGDGGRPRLDLAQLSSLFGPDHLGPLAVATDSQLVRAALVEIGPAPTWSTQLVAPAPRVMWHLVGDDSPDPRLPLDLDVVAGVADDDEGEGNGDGDDLLLVVGVDPTRRLQAAAERLRGSLFLSCSAPTDGLTWQALIREATISGTGIVVHVGDVLPVEARHWVERTPHLAWALTSAAELPLECLPRRPWREVLADDPHASPDEVKAVFGDEVDDMSERRLTARQLHMVVSAAEGVGGATAALRRLAAGPIEKLARRIRPRIGWDDLVLPAEQMAQLRELTARYRNRSIVHGRWGATEFPSPGVAALLAGPSGTGKTTAAEVLAADLEVDLFKIDVSSVVSKYIGETEKNLEELFSVASSGDLVLCFDEADALLGKRSEVSDARDRYANLEVSYLLQRLETYEGFVVLTTNLQSNIDDAFLRRFHARISFPTPGVEERKRIWERALRGVPTDGLDLDAIAQRFDLVGGSIRNAAMNGAFLAAEAGRPLDMPLVMLGLKREFQKQGRLLTRELFGEWFDRINVS